MSKVSFYELNDQEREVVLGQHSEIKAKFIKKTEGLSGDIYIFDQGSVCRLVMSVQRCPS